jgi:hypothetical protein
MTSSADGDSNFLVLGVLECNSNVLLGTRLDEERWAHAVLVPVAGSGILVMELIIFGIPRRDLLADSDIRNVN